MFELQVIDQVEDRFLREYKYGDLCRIADQHRHLVVIKQVLPVACKNIDLLFRKEATGNFLYLLGMIHFQKFSFLNR